MKAHLETLKATIKADTAETRALRQQARATHGDERAQLKAEANYGRHDRRTLHLAYCYLRGRTYHQCEAKCLAVPLAESLARHAFCAEIPLSRAQLTDSIKLWLSRGNVTRKEVETTPDTLQQLEEAEQVVQRLQTAVGNTEKNIAAKERVLQSDRDLLEHNRTALQHAKNGLAELQGVSHG